MKEKHYIVAKSISRWKLDNWFENWLSHKADESESWKKLYVLYYQFFDHKYYVSGLRYINAEIEKQLPNLTKSWGKVNIDYLRRDMIYSLHRYGVNFFEYFVYKFYNKSALGRSRINNLRIQYGYCEIVNDPSMRELFDNKAKTYEVLKQFYKRDLLLVESNEDVKLFEKFVSKHRDFILKPLKGVHGYGIAIFHDFKEKPFDFVTKTLTRGPFVVEELIEQAPEMAILHPESINTLRIATFKVGNDVKIYGAAIRMGTGNAFVDNAGSGGIFCRVNPDFGFVETNAIDYIGNEYVFHPNSNIRLIGFDIPQWKELKELAENTALAVAGATVISWDFAFSKKGWCLLEANDVGGPDLIQNYENGNKQLLTSLIDKFLKKN